MLITKISSLIITFLFLLSSCPINNKTKAIRLAHILDTRDHVHKAMEFLKRRLHEKSKGKLQLQIYPSSQLGDEDECLELHQIGSLDITKVSDAILENSIPKYKIVSIPYIFRDKTHRFSVLDGAENTPPSFYTSKHYKVCKYYSIDEHTSIPDVQVISFNT